MLNRVMLIGRLGADPELRYLPNGDAVATIRLATSERYRDRASGEAKEATEWHRVVFFGRLAEVVGEYPRKGSSIYVEGRIRTRKWQDARQQDRYTTEVVAGQLRMLGARPNSESQEASGSPPPAEAGRVPGDDDESDDVPF